MSRPRLAVAMDFTSRETFQARLQVLEGLPVVLKIGLRLLPWISAGEIRALADRFELFVDAKLHDIPSQTAEAAQVWESLGARYLTVHLSGGRPMLEAVSRATRPDRLHVAGVSVLTSLNVSDLEELGTVPPSPEAQVVRLVRLGMSAGLRSFVCSVAELGALRRALGPESDDAEFITPGLVLANQGAHADQSRVSTIEDALREGSDVLVVGRSIWGSPDPRATALSILERLLRA